MAARRYHSLHHNLQEGDNVIFHREHRSKRGRSKNKVWGMPPAYRRNSKANRRALEGQTYLAETYRPSKKRRKANRELQ